MLGSVWIGAEQHRAGRFPLFVGGTFVFGWALGLLVVLKVWHLAHAPRWVMLSGVGYVTLMLLPAAFAFSITWLAGRLVARGWGGGPLRLAAAGLLGLVGGLLAL